MPLTLKIIQAYKMGKKIFSYAMNFKANQMKKN